MQRHSNPRAMLVIAAASFVLTGCFVQNSRMSETREQVASAYARCDQRYAAGLIKSHLAAVNCATPDVIAAYQAAGYPFEDLVYVSIEARRRGAANVDRGDVTEAQYEHDAAELDTRIAAEEARRRTTINRTGTPSLATPDMLVAGLPAFATTPAAGSIVALPPGSCIPLGDLRPCK